MHTGHSVTTTGLPKRCPRKRRTSLNHGVLLIDHVNSTCGEAAINKSFKEEEGILRYKGRKEALRGVQDDPDREFYTRGRVASEWILYDEVRHCKEREKRACFCAW